MCTLTDNGTWENCFKDDLTCVTMLTSAQTQTVAEGFFHETIVDMFLQPTVSNSLLYKETHQYASEVLHHYPFCSLWVVSRNIFQAFSRDIHFPLGS